MRLRLETSKERPIELMTNTSGISDSNSGKVVGHFTFSSHSLEKDKAKASEEAFLEMEEAETLLKKYLAM